VAHPVAASGVVLLAVLCAGCAAIPKDQKALLAAPADCTDPGAQIAALEEMRPTGFRRFTTTATMISPGGLAGMAIHNDYQDRQRIIGGDLGREIDAKIAGIRAACTG
jgi:hypothetical protein